MAGLSLLPNLGLGGMLGTTGTVGTASTPMTPGSKAQNISKATTQTTKLINDLVARIATAKEKAASASQAELPQLQRAITTLQSQLQDLARAEEEESLLKNKRKSINNNKDRKDMKKTASHQVQEGMFKGAAKGAAKGAVLGGLGGAALGALTLNPVGVVGGAISGAAKGAGLGGIVGGVTDEDDEGMKKSKKKKHQSKQPMRTKTAVVTKEGVTKTVGKVAGTVGGAYGGGTLGAAAGAPIGSTLGGALGAAAGIPLGPAGMAAGGALGAAAGGAAGTIGGALGGGALGAKVGHDVGGWAGRKIEGENEESMDKLTPIQDEVVDALARNKYYVNRVSYQFAEEEGGPTVFMSKKPNRYSTRYAEVGPDGFVNGESLEDFLKGHEENEEKMLSKKQQRIAKLGGDPNKIDAADFAKLRAMKEATETCPDAKKGCKCDECEECRDNQTVKEKAEIPVFLRAILQKNYAQADKYLGSIVNEKIKNLINKALDNTNL